MLKIAITGVSRGLGKALGIEFQSQGYEVHGICRREPREQLPFFLSLVDIRDYTAYQNWLETVRPDILVLNAGVGTDGTRTQTNFSTIISMVETNFISTTLAAKWALSNLKHSNKIALISSLSAWVPSAEWAFYGATKAACENLMESLRSKFRERGISLTIVLPGSMDTEFFEFARVQSPPKNKLIQPSKFASEIVEAIISGNERYVTPVDRNAFELFERLPLREAQKKIELT